MSKSAAPAVNPIALPSAWRSSSASGGTDCSASISAGTASVPRAAGTVSARASDSTTGGYETRPSHSTSTGRCSL